MFVDAGAGAGTEDTNVGLVTPGMFSVFHVSPILGRTFTDEETLPERYHVAVLSQSMWQNRFGSDPNVVGRTIQLSGAACTIIGVMPAGFSFPDRAQLWRPLAIDPAKLDRGPHFLHVVGRLKPGVTLAQAQADMSPIAARLSQQYAEKNAGHGVKLELLATVVVGDIGLALYVLLGAVEFVLLIACANLANLTLARVGARQKRLQFAPRWEPAGCASCGSCLSKASCSLWHGGAAGLLLAIWAVSWVVSLSPDTIPRVHEISVDPARGCVHTRSFTGDRRAVRPRAGAACLQTDLTDALKESGRTTAGLRRSRLRSVLVMSEVALSLVLLVGAGLMIRSFCKTQSGRSGIQSGPGAHGWRCAFPQQVSGGRTGRAALCANPGTRRSYAWRRISRREFPDLPLSGSNTSDSFTIEGRPAIAKEAEPSTEYRVVTPRYFESMGIPLLTGRDIAWSDTRRSPNVCLINDAFARQHFQGEEPVGPSPEASGPGA